MSWMPVKSEHKAHRMSGKEDTNGVAAGLVLLDPTRFARLPEFALEDARELTRELARLKKY